MMLIQMRSGESIAELVLLDVFFSLFFNGWEMKIYIQANHSQLLRYGSWPKYFVMRNDNCIDYWHWKLPICTKNTWWLN